MTTIPSASQPTLNVSSQAIGGSITINTNRLHTSFTHILSYVFGNQSADINYFVTDSQTWTLPNWLANAIPNGTSGSGTIICETYDGSTLIGIRTVAFTVTVPNNATFQPNASISSITEGQGGLTPFSVFIQNHSRLRVQSTGSGNFGATISQQRVTIDGGHLFGTDVTFNPINKNGTLTVTLLVTDSRGYSRTVTQNVTLVEYFAPRINSFSASRSPNDQGTDLSALINFEIAPVSNQNTRLYRVRYRVVGGSWVLLFESIDYYSRIFTHTATGVLNANNSYEIELYMGDYFTAVTQTVIVTTAFDLLNFNQSGKGVAIGKVSEKDWFEVDLPTEFNGKAVFKSEITGISRPSIIGVTLSSAGWYRVLNLSFNTFFEALFVHGHVMEMYLCRTFQNTNNESHKVTMLAAYNKVNFFKQSAINTQLITGIRYQRSSDTLGHIDIYYSGTSVNDVYFSVALLNSLTGAIESNGTFQNVTSEPTQHGSTTNLI